MSRSPLPLVALGGALGVATRWALTGSVTTFGSALDVGLLAANILGCLILGAALAGATARPERARVLRAGVGTGFCGGLTTFSTLTVHVAQLLDDESYWSAATELIVSVLVGGLAIVVGRYVGRQLIPDAP